MAFEVVKGRVCDSLANAQFIEILKLQTALLSQGKVVTVQKQEIALQDSILLSHVKEMEQTRVLHRSEKRGLIREIRRLKAWVVGLGVTGAVKTAIIFIIVL